jgi:hypothetical protein
MSRGSKHPCAGRGRFPEGHGACGMTPLPGINAHSQGSSSTGTSCCIRVPPAWQKPEILWKLWALFWRVRSVLDRLEDKGLFLLRQRPLDTEAFLGLTQDQFHSFFIIDTIISRRPGPSFSLRAIAPENWLEYEFARERIKRLKKGSG